MTAPASTYRIQLGPGRTFSGAAVGSSCRGGADLRLDQHWGGTFDVKKLFADSTSQGTGIDLGVLDAPSPNQLPLVSTQKTTFEPWILSTGVTYRW